MTRITSPRKTKRRTLLSATKGYKKPANNHFKIAHQRFLKAQVHAFRDRRNKKRVFRHLWIGRLNDRKLMAQLAIYDWSFFKYLMQSIN